MAVNKEILLIEIREDGARVVRRNIQAIGRTASKTESQVDDLKSTLLGLVTGKLIKDTIMLADTYANLLNRLRVVTASQFELTAAMQGVFEMTMATRTSLEANIDMFARVKLNTQQLGLSLEKVLDFTTQLNKAIILSGVTAREAQWGMIQFAQAMAAGALRGDELRAVMEQLPVVTDVLAEHFNVTRGQLRLLGFQGRITTRDMIEAFDEADKSLSEKFLKRLPTIDQGLTSIRSSFLRFLGEQDQAFQGTSSFANVLLEVSKNMDTFGRVAEIAGIIIGSLLLKNMTAVIAKTGLFSAALIKTNPLMFFFSTAAVGVGVYGDKIRISADETTTLADVSNVMAQRLAESWKAIGKSISGAFDMSQAQQDHRIGLQAILLDLGSFVDAYFGAFVGLRFGIEELANQTAIAVAAMINSPLDILKSVTDNILATLSGVISSIRQSVISLQSALITIRGSLDQLFAGNLQASETFRRNAVNSLQKAAAALGPENMAKNIADNLVDLGADNVLLLTAAEAGKKIADAFGKGFNTSNLIRSGLEDIFDSADVISRKRTEGEISDPEKKNPLTVKQSQLLNQITGDIEGLTQKVIDAQVLLDQELITVLQFERTVISINQKLLATSTDVASGFKRGFAEITLDVTNFADMAQKSVTNAFSGMEDALVSFVTTGKVDFHSLVQGMLADITRLLARMLIVKALGAFGGPAGGLLSFAAGATAPATVPTRAAGGPGSPGRDLIVGDRGRPEIFRPTVPGKIMNEQQVAAEQKTVAPIIIYNVWSKEDVPKIMSEAEGQRVIINSSPGTDRA